MNKKILEILLAVVAAMLWSSGVSAASQKVWGWGWMETIGWVSFSSMNCDVDGNGTTNNDSGYYNCPVGQPTVSYGVYIDDATGVMSGYAWSETIGWVSFNQADLTSCPGVPKPCIAKVDLANGQVTGWAKPISMPDNWIELGGFNIGGTLYNTIIESNGSVVCPPPMIANCGSEFKGFGFGSGLNGGTGATRGDAVIGWLSFNKKNCDSNNDNTYDGGAYPYCMSPLNPVGLTTFGGSAQYYKVTTTFRVNASPVAAITCNPASCEVFQGDVLTLNNVSTDPQGISDISQSQWWTKYASDPSTYYVLQNACIFCNYTTSLGLGGAADYRDYTAKLRATDAGGLYSEAEKAFRIKRNLSADFECSLTDGGPWASCNDPTISPFSGDLVYLHDASQSSYGGSISSRIWNKNDVDGNSDFSVANNPAPNIAFKAPNADIRLTVTDSNGKTKLITYTINGKMRLPTWKEVNPAW